LDLKIVGDPESQVAEDEEGEDLPARLLVLVLLVNLLLLQVGDEEQLQVNLDQSINYNKDIRVQSHTWWAGMSTTIVISQSLLKIQVLNL
jgi:hypothetical protein